MNEPSSTHETSDIVSQEKIPPNHSSPAVPVLLGLVFLSTAGLVYFGYQNHLLRSQSTAAQGIQQYATTNVSNQPAVTSIPTATPTSGDWKTSKYGAMFSYQYPSGWHVAELWPSDYKSGVTIAMDPNPINTAPRDGSIATFVITLLNGAQNPNEVLSKRIAEFNATNYSDIFTETLDSPAGPVQYYRGNMLGELAHGQQVESYFLTIQNPSDPANTQDIEVNMTFQKDPKLSELLRHVALNFKRLN